MSSHGATLIGIFTHLKLCLADTIHNFKWLKILVRLVTFLKPIIVLQLVKRYVYSHGFGAEMRY